PAPAPAAPPPETRVVAPPLPPRETGIVSPPVPATGPPPGTPGQAVAPEMPPGTEAPGLTRRSYTSASGQQDVYEFEPLSELAADAAEAGIKDFRNSTPEQRAQFNQLRIARRQREQISDADVARMSRPLSESERNSMNYLMKLRLDLDKFYRDFDTPEK